MTPKPRALPAAPPETQRLLSLREVCRIVPVARNSIWRWVKAGKFPPPAIVGPRSLWAEREVAAWVQAQLDARGPHARIWTLAAEEKRA